MNCMKRTYNKYLDKQDNEPERKPMSNAKRRDLASILAMAAIFNAMCGGTVLLQEDKEGVEDV